MAKSLRKKTNHEILGQPADLNENFLPHIVDVLRYLKFRKIELETIGKTFTFYEVAEFAATRIVGIWERFGFPVVTKKSITDRMTNLWGKYKNLNKVSTNARDERWRARWSEEVGLDDLFDISTCRCYDAASDKSDIFEIRRRCTCPAERKIPLIEWESYCLAKEGQSVVLGALDIQETQRLRKREERHEEKRQRDAKAAASLKSFDSEASVNDLADDDDTPLQGATALPDPDFMDEPSQVFFLFF